MIKRFKEMNNKALLFVLLGVLIGVVVYAGSVTAIKATDTGEFCSSCHVMDTVYEAFTNSPHARLDCNDCHAPTDSIVEKMVFKAKAGLGHIYMNTIGASKIPDVLHATEDSVDVINKNCISCHSYTIENVSHDSKGTCIDCHRQVPHGLGIFKSPDWHLKLNIDAAK
ncbi:nitrate reductase [Anaerobacillus alkalilacustris]|uniref:Cytochrome c-type protein n=1 Tax=Anaerobacillus alkalilacustris TaxID=393763 RepID=A0A1S2LQB3_9BACI|nr:NapC/NirT family cytochrome c [Anaerobacillus alkalilacustris]OIJ14698.1 nitrate reductase [Anaerobacillus alkalilacustris]